MLIEQYNFRVDFRLIYSNYSQTGEALSVLVPLFTDQRHGLALTSKIQFNLLSFITGEKA